MISDSLRKTVTVNYLCRTEVHSSIPPSAVLNGETNYDSNHCLTGVTGIFNRQEKCHIKVGYALSVFSIAGSICRLKLQANFCKWVRWNRKRNSNYQPIMTMQPYNDFIDGTVPRAHPFSSGLARLAVAF